MIYATARASFAQRAERSRHWWLPVSLLASDHLLLASQQTLVLGQGNGLPSEKMSLAFTTAAREAKHPRQGAVMDHIPSRLTPYE